MTGSRLSLCDTQQSHVKPETALNHTQKRTQINHDIFALDLLTDMVEDYNNALLELKYYVKLSTNYVCARALPSKLCCDQFS